MNNIVGYIRVSTETQTEGFGLDAQSMAIMEYAKKHRLGNVKIYTERGVSGAIEDRPAFGQLMLDADDGNIHKVIIVRLDRLARDLMIQETIIAHLMNLSVELISIDEPDLCSDDPSRVLFRQIRGAISEYEKKMIKIRLKAGRMTKAQQGGFAGGRTPLGYQRVIGFNGKKKPDLEINPERAEVIKIIFKKKRNGWSLAKIARYLNDNNYPTATGGKWYHSTVNYILQNSIYRGKISYNGQTTKRLELAIKR